MNLLQNLKEEDMSLLNIGKLSVLATATAIMMMVISMITPWLDGLMGHGYASYMLTACMVGAAVLPLIAIATLTAHVVRQARYERRVAEAAEAAELDAVFASIQEGMDAHEASIKTGYADKLRVLYSLAKDMQGSGYVAQYESTMTDWVAYSEQEPDRYNLLSLRRAVERAHEVFENPAE